MVSSSGETLSKTSSFAPMQFLNQPLQVHVLSLLSANVRLKCAELPASNIRELLMLYPLSLTELAPKIPTIYTTFSGNAPRGLERTPSLSVVYSNKVFKASTFAHPSIDVSIALTFVLTAALYVVILLGTE